MKKIIRRKIEMGDRVAEIGTQDDLNPSAPITALFTQSIHGGDFTVRTRQ